MKKNAGSIAIMILLLLCLASPLPAADKNPLPEELPVPGLVTLIDLGAATCIPCKMMAPILEELKKEYEGKAAVVFIDLRYHKEMAGKFQVRAIPTQILFDQNGNEVGRHEGFLPKEAIVNAFEQLGVSK